MALRSARVQFAKVLMNLNLSRPGQFHLCHEATPLPRAEKQQAYHRLTVEVLTCSKGNATFPPPLTTASVLKHDATHLKETKCH